MTAESVLRAMCERYAAMESYQDHGVVVLKSPDKPETNKIQFSTVFRRPNRFRFEWTTHHPYPALHHVTTTRVIWFDGANAFTHIDRDNGGTRQEESLQMAIGRAGGVSLRSSLTVACLLLPEVGVELRVKIGEMTNLEYREDSCEGAGCHVVFGTNVHGDPQEVRIATDDYTLRSSSITDLSSGRVITEYRQDICIAFRRDESD
jgi:hypothetical protein